MTDVKSMLAAELEEQLCAWGEPRFRAAQVLQWLYQRKVTSWDRMTNLPRTLRQRLSETYSLRQATLVKLQGSKDTTAKFLWRLGDNSLIETVLIPANAALYGESSDRQTLCVSTQVGCAYGCRFCASGLEGFKRNLTPDEIVEQVVAVERWDEELTLNSDPLQASPSSLKQPSVPVPRLVSNLVIMGMGEPLANYDNLLKAIRILNAPWGMGIGARKITVSTSGLAPQIRRLADEPLQLRLAISLHGATDDVRGMIMPINRKYPLSQLVAACEYYHEKIGRLITFEYILIAGVNDGLDQVKPLAQLAKRLNAKVNLIPYNTVEGLSWHRPVLSVQEHFQRALEKLGVTATLRNEKGHDIDAACGQLRLRTERAEALTGAPS